MASPVRMPLWLSRDERGNHEPREAKSQLPAVREHADEDDAPLYVDADEPRAGEPATLRLVPYYSWANREIGEMRVFQRR